MNYFGLFPTYKVNRPLSKKEVKHRLAQKRRLDVEPKSQLCVIKMNSTFLESVDKWYGWRGSLLLFMIPATAMPLWLIGSLISIAVSKAGGWPLLPYDIEILLMTVPIALLWFFAGLWLVLKDCFSFTHYPMRFNRKKRVVHVFHTDGTVSATPWDEIYFTLGHMKGLHEWEVRGHILEPNTSTIRRTFALGYTGPLNSNDIDPGVSGPSEYDFIRSHWEFIRRYMEDGPEAVAGQVQFCMPLDGRRESIRVGTERVFANFALVPFVIYLVAWPLCALTSLFRIFAMRTSKIPVWPDDVEKDCLIEVDDPYAIVGDEIGDRVAVYPEAAAAAGVEFREAVEEERNLRSRTGTVKVTKHGDNLL